MTFKWNFVFLLFELKLNKINDYRKDEKNTDGSEKEISYGEYVEKINKRALKE